MPGDELSDCSYLYSHLVLEPIIMLLLVMWAHHYMTEYHSVTLL